MNMSLDLKIKNQQLKLLQENNFLFPDEDCNIIIPYLPSGYKDYSNNGYVQGQKLIDNYLTYKRLWTGNDAFTITWKGSTYMTKNPDSNINLKINWQLGEYILGYNESHYSSVDITDDSALTDYKKTVAENTITFRIRADKYDLNENYKYMFYKVPEISNNIIYRVVSLDTEYIGRTKVCYVLTLKSLQQELENTGRAKQQNIMNSAPGSGYYDPLILEDGKEYKETETLKRIDRTRWLTIDYTKYINNPVKYVVVKAFGLCWFNSFSCVGRRVNRLDDMTTYTTPRLIFPINYVQASTPTLYRTQTAEDNYYWLNGTLTIQFTKDMYEAMQDFMDVNKVWTNQGIVQYQQKGDTKEPESTNPKTNGVYSYTLYGNTQEIGGKLVYKPWKFGLDREINYDTTGVMGCETTTYMRGKDRFIHDYNWAAYWCHKAYSVVPLGIENTMTFGNMVGGGLQTAMSGGIANIITGGILFGIGILGSMFSKVANKNLKNGICGMIPAKLFDFMANEASGSLGNKVANVNWFKLSYLMGGEENDFIKFFNTSTMNTSFQAELTDLFEKNNIRYETTYIGQTKKENGDKIFDNGNPLLVNGDETLVELGTDNIGFIIDSFNIQAIYSGDYSVEFLNKDKEVIWSTIIQSQAKWSGSIREWNTWQDTSIYGVENIYLDEPVKWPEYPAIPDIGTSTGDISIPLDAEFKVVDTREMDNSFNDYDLQKKFTTKEIYEQSTQMKELNWELNVYDSYFNKKISYGNQMGDGYKKMKIYRIGKTDGTNQIMKYTKDTSGQDGWNIKQLIFTNRTEISPDFFWEVYNEIKLTIYDGSGTLTLVFNKDNYSDQSLKTHNKDLATSVWFQQGLHPNAKQRITEVMHVRNNYYNTTGTSQLFDAHWWFGQPIYTKNHTFYEYKSWIEFDKDKVYLHFSLENSILYVDFDASKYPNDKIYYQYVIQPNTKVNTQYNYPAWTNDVLKDGTIYEANLVSKDNVNYIDRLNTGRYIYQPTLTIHQRGTNEGQKIYNYITMETRDTNGNNPYSELYVGLQLKEISAVRNLQQAEIYKDSIIMSMETNQDK